MPTGSWGTMRDHPVGRDAKNIGEVFDDHAGMIVMRAVINGVRLVTLMAREQLPRMS
jgi:hydrogenase expression/formation protein HypE